MRCTPKKTVAQIIQSGNDYLITVKGNQPTLFAQLQTQFEQAPALSVDVQTEQTRDRQTQRTVSVLNTVADLDPHWLGVQRLVRIERVGTRSNQPYTETMFYISSLALDAAGFAQRIRQHWHIENRLHWVKDVVLKEDQAPLCDGYALTNFAIVRTMALNLFRRHGFDSITQGLRRMAHDIPGLFSYFQ
jgi:predicted transposase YbfD/YdcC